MIRQKITYMVNGRGIEQTFVIAPNSLLIYEKDRFEHLWYKNRELYEGSAGNTVWK